MKRCQNCFCEYDESLEMCPFCGYVEGGQAEESVHMNPGSILVDRYLIGKVLGFGGFGVTYLAWDAKLEVKVAIKEYLPSEFSTRMPGQSRVTIFNGDKAEQFADGLNKFVDEARRLAKFQNEDGIVRVYDCIAENNTAYIIMEYLEGETLTSLLKREKSLTEEKTIEMMLPLMKSLQVVHAEGILHRDIAPDNVFITSDGKVKLIDFGAARFATTSHSRSLTVIVKPGYSPEEQYRSRSDQGEHTDVYSLASTMYKMMTGVTPPDALERRAKIQNSHKEILVNPRKFNASISQNVENAILNAMNVQVEDRTKTVQSFIDELESVEPVKRVYGKIKKLDFYTWPLWLKVLIPTLLSMLVIVGILIGTGVVGFTNLFNKENAAPEGYVVVPSLEGIPYEDAIKLLEDNGINYVTDNTRKSSYVKKNNILYQTPNAGAFIKNDEDVRLVISRGSGEIVLPIDGISTVPYFIGEKKESAEEYFKTAGFVPSCAERNTKSVSKGLVIEVTDKDNHILSSGEKYPEGTEVVIYVSVGPKTKKFPNLIGLTKKQAIQKIEDAGQNFSGYRYEYSKKVKPGYVVSQSVPAGQNVYYRECEVIIGIATDDKNKTNKLLMETPTPTPTPKTDNSISQRKWSKWDTKLPDGVDSKNCYDIQSRTEYRYRNKKTQISSESHIDGWEIESSSYSEWSEWSEWQAKEVTKSETCDVVTRISKENNQFTEYRYRTRTVKNTFVKYSSWTEWSTQRGKGDEEQVRLTYRYMK